MSNFQFNNPNGKWQVDLSDPLTIPVLCTKLEDYLAPPDAVRAGCMAGTLRIVITKIYLEKQKPIPEVLKQRLTVINQRLNVLRYTPFPKDWTL
jgi:hypothetical protein